MKYEEFRVQRWETIFRMALKELEATCERDLCHLSFLDENKKLQAEYLEKVAILDDVKELIADYEFFLTQYKK